MKNIRNLYTRQSVKGLCLPGVDGVKHRLNPRSGVSISTCSFRIVHYGRGLGRWVSKEKYNTRCHFTIICDSLC